MHSGCLTGHIVRTPFGWGLVTEDNPTSWQIQVALDWSLRGGRRVKASLRRTDVLERSFCPIGHFVETQFGYGVVVDFRREDSIHVVRLWRRTHGGFAGNGGGSGLLFCKSGALRRALKAAPGFPTETPYGAGVVREVSSAHGGAAVRYTVDLGWAVVHLSERNVRSPISAALLVSECVRKLARQEVARCAELFRGSEFKHLRPAGITPAVDCTSEDAPSRCNPVKHASVEALLGHGLARLQTLADEHKLSSADDARASHKGTNRLPPVTVDSLCSAFGQLGKVCETSAHVAGVNVDARVMCDDNVRSLLHSIGIAENVHVPALIQAIGEDAELREILCKVGRDAHLRPGIPGDVLRSRTGKLLREGGDRFGASLREARAVGTEQLSRIGRRARTVQESLASEPMVCDKATELLYGVWQSADAQLGRSSHQLAAQAGAVVARGLEEHARVIGHLCGGIERVNLQNIRFEELLFSGTPLANCVSKFDERLEQSIAMVLDEQNADPRLAGADLVDRFRNEADHVQWGALLAEAFDSDQVVFGAKEFMQRGEALLIRGCTGLQSSTVALDAVERHLEQKDLESHLKRAAARFQTGAFVSAFDKALRGGPAARDSFLNRLLDYCVDGFLDLAPSLRIPEVSGQHLGVTYTFHDLDMSGLRIQRSNVQLKLRRGDRVNGGACHKPGRPYLCLEACDVRAEFRQLRCRLHPPMLPQVAVLTRANATGISLRVMLALSNGREGKDLQHKMVVKALESELKMEKLDIVLDQSKGARLFNPMVGRLRESLRRHVCASLAERLRTGLESICNELGGAMSEVALMLHLVGFLPSEPSHGADASEHT